MNVGVPSIGSVSLVQCGRRVSEKLIGLEPTITKVTKIVVAFHAAYTALTKLTVLMSESS